MKKKEMGRAWVKLPSAVMEELEPRLTLNTDTPLGRRNKDLIEHCPSRFLSLTHMILLHRELCHYHPDLSQILHFDDADFVPMLVWRPATALPRHKTDSHPEHYVLEVVAPSHQFDDFPVREGIEYLVCLSFEDSDRVIRSITTRNRADTVAAIRACLAYVDSLHPPGKAQWQRRRNQKRRQRQRLARQSPS